MKRLLIDTHVLLWWLAGDSALSSRAHDAIADPHNVPLVSVASLWEIAIKRSLGKLTAPDDLPDRIVQQGFDWMPIGSAHAWAVRELGLHHRDPFDRLLVAQATIEHLPVVTADPRIGAYAVETWW